MHDWVEKAVQMDVDRRRSRTRNGRDDFMVAVVSSSIRAFLEVEFWNPSRIRRLFPPTDGRRHVCPEVGK